MGRGWGEQHPNLACQPSAALGQALLQAYMYVPSARQPCCSPFAATLCSPPCLHPSLYARHSAACTVGEVGDAMA